MKTYLRILRYAGRYPGTVAAALVLALLVAVLYTAQIATLIPVFNVLFDERGLQEALVDPEVQPYLLAAASMLGAEEQILGLDGSLAVRKRLFLLAVVLLIAILIVQHVFRFMQEYVVGRVVQLTIRDINKELYRRVIHLPVHFFRNQGSGDIVSRFTNDAFLVAGGTKTILEKSIREPLKIVFVLAFALSIDAQLTFLTFICIPVAGVLAYAIGRKVKKGTSRMLKGRSRMITMLREVVSGIRIVKVARAEEREIARFDREADNIYKQQMLVVLADAAATPVMVSLTSIFAAAAIIAAGYQVFDKALNPGEFMAFYGAIFAVLDPVRRMSSIWNKIQTAVAGGERVFEFIDQRNRIHDRPMAALAPRLAQSLEFRNVYFHYEEGKPVLRGIDLVIQRGETVALVGRSGSGKSTLVNLVPRFEDPTPPTGEDASGQDDGGAIYLDGIDLRDVRLASLRGQIGIVTQEPILFRTTIRENIRYARPEATDDEVEQAARKAHAHEFVMAREHGYRSIVGDDGATLSGGERQRIALARAILADPALLILDEASSSLDTVSEAAIQDAMTSFMRGRTSIVIAHRLSTIESADRIIVLDGGRVEAIGPHRQLLEESPTYRELHAAQWRGAEVDS